MKNFGFGLMRLLTTDPANAGAIDMEQVKKMVDLFIEKGFTYATCHLAIESPTGTMRLSQRKGSWYGRSSASTWRGTPCSSWQRWPSVPRFPTGKTPLVGTKT